MREVSEAWAREARAYKEINKLRHLNIINHIAAISRGSNSFLVSEWADGGALRDLWRNNEPHLTPTLVKDTVHQLYGLAHALEELHRRAYRHGLIKPENIVRMRSRAKQSGSSDLDIGTLKFCDMGLTKYHNLVVQLQESETHM